MNDFNPDYNVVRVGLQPIGNAGPPKVGMNGGESDIPVVTFTEWPTAFEIHLGNHDDPERWLRDTAAVLVDLADTINAKRIEARA